MKLDKFEARSGPENAGGRAEKKKKEKTGFDFHSSVKKERPAFRLR